MPAAGNRPPEPRREINGRYRRRLRPRRRCRVGDFKEPRFRLECVDQHRPRSLPDRSKTERLVKDLSKHLGSEFMPAASGNRISGIYDRAISTPTAKIAVIRREDTFTLAPWKPALEPMRGLAVTATLGPNRVSWTLDRGRGLPPRG